MGSVISKEERDAATVDLPGFLLQTKMEEHKYVLLKLTITTALLLVDSDPKK